VRLARGAQIQPDRQFDQVADQHRSAD
jgi:hypothetical protein